MSEERRVIEEGEAKGGDVIPEELLSRLETGAGAKAYAQALDDLRNSGVLCQIRIAMEEAGYVVHDVTYTADGEGNVLIGVKGRKAREEEGPLREEEHAEKVREIIGRGDG